MTLGRTELDSAAQLLRLPSLYFYDWTLPAWTAALYPGMASLPAGGKTTKIDLFWSQQSSMYRGCLADFLCTAAGLPPLAVTSAALPLVSSGGESFVAFEKATTPLQEVFLYEGILEPYFSAGRAPGHPSEFIQAMREAPQEDLLTW